MVETWLRSCYVHHSIRQPSIKCLVRVTFKLSKTTGQLTSIFFFNFFIFLIFLYQAQWEKKTKRD